MKHASEPSTLRFQVNSKPYIRQLIEAKREWSEPLSEADELLGFHGWRSRGYLPHFDAPGTRQMITYRLDDSMPVSRRHEWEPLLAIENEREKRIKIEQYLDAGHGECHLRQPIVAGLVQENLLHFDGSRYRLLAWVVMPNHVHALIEMLVTPLMDVLHGWKSFTGKAANLLLQREARFWQPEYFDRFIRDEEHFGKAVRYIENNPVKAGLAKSPEEWPFGSARYRNAGDPPPSSK